MKNILICDMIYIVRSDVVNQCTNVKVERFNKNKSVLFKNLNLVFVYAFIFIFGMIIVFVVTSYLNYKVKEFTESSIAIASNN